MMSERLPIYDLENDILRALKETRRLVLQAPTGSGTSNLTSRQLGHRCPDGLYRSFMHRKPLTMDQNLLPEL